jgi:hypothetical protein
MDSRVGSRAKVFINYRGSDAGWAVYLDNVLSTRFGPDRVFRASRSIQPSEDFIDRILSTVETSKVLVAVIGPGWLAATDRTGRRALDGRDDWVRREIAYAFDKQVPVLPLLVDDTPPLLPEDLPDDIAQLSRCQYLRMSYRSAESDTGRLAEELVKLVPELAAPRRTRRMLIAAVSLAVVLAGVGAASVAGRPWWSGDGTSDSSSPSVAAHRSIDGTESARAPYIDLRPPQGSPTSPFEVHGHAFPPRLPVKISIVRIADGKSTDVGSTTTNEFGEFVTTVDPSKTGRLGPGDHFVSTNVNDDPRYHIKYRYRVVS